MSVLKVRAPCIRSPIGVRTTTCLLVLTCVAKLSSSPFLHWAELHQRPHFPLGNDSGGTGWFCSLVSGLLSRLLLSRLLSHTLPSSFLVFSWSLHDTQGHPYIFCYDTYNTPPWKNKFSIFHSSLYIHHTAVVDFDVYNGSCVVSFLHPAYITCYDLSYI